MSENEKLDNLANEVWGSPAVPGLSRRMDRAEDTLSRLVLLEERRSAWISRIIAAVIIFGLLQLTGAVIFFFTLGFKSHMMGS